MAKQSYTSRRELDQYGFHASATVLVPLVFLLLQTVVPNMVPALAVLDLPLVVTIFFALARRNPIAGAVTGTVIGLLQDGLTNHPFGVFGIAKAVVGYAAASIGFVVDVENISIRAGLTFGFSLLQSLLLYLIYHLLLGDVTYAAQPLHELLRAVVNSVVAVPAFFLLDRFKTRGD
jgi:rod shape-determining protein MreD